ncbi:P-loop ATPase, Sll1717 family [Roseibium sp.]|uniref:P-loop ATPase, Sll1717 family n=1 Tax=Roseibium sp. TaxID=1936156 RepID=UPI003BAAEF9C
MKRKILYKSDSHIGEIAAEYDDVFLQNCFVSIPVVDQLLDIESSKCILLGRTGSGKTAILNHIEEFEHHTVRIEPSNVSFDYIANSNIIQFLRENGFDFKVLFLFLWKHIIFSKSVQCFFDNQSSFNFQLDKLTGRNTEARKYLDSHNKNFWIEQDEVVREISQGLEEKIETHLRAILGDSFAKIEGGAKAEAKIDSSQSVQIKTRLQKAVNELQFRDLQRAMSTLNDLMANKHKKYYILIDDLDLDWAPEELKYDLINSLIEAINGFRKVRKIKVLAAIRSDLYERSIRQRNTDGFQPEKYEGTLLNIKWRENELRHLVDERVGFLFKDKYTKQGIKFKDIFPNEIRNINSFKFICERTQYRPRDIIAFVNDILDKAAGTSDIVSRYVVDAEAVYSNKRLDALYHEWKGLHPCLKVYVESLRGKTGKITFGELANRDFVSELCLRTMDHQEAQKNPDSVVRECNIYSMRENERRLHQVVRELVAVLYKVGAVMVRLQKGDKEKTCYKDDATITPSEVTETTSIKVTPVFWRALGITPNIG